MKPKFTNAMGSHEDLLIPGKRRKFLWDGHVTKSTGLVKTILQGTAQGETKKGRHRKRWEDITNWTRKILCDNLRRADD